MSTKLAVTRFVRFLESRAPPPPPMTSSPRSSSSSLRQGGITCHRLYHLIGVLAYDAGAALALPYPRVESTTVANLVLPNTVASLCLRVRSDPSAGYTRDFAKPTLATGWTYSSLVIKTLLAIRYKVPPSYRGNLKHRATNQVSDTAIYLYQLTRYFRPHLLHPRQPVDLPRRRESSLTLVGHIQTTAMMTIETAMANSYLWT
jgi:hypothetical protein